MDRDLLVSKLRVILKELEAPTRNNRSPVQMIEEYEETCSYALVCIKRLIKDLEDGK